MWLSRSDRPGDAHILVVILSVVGQMPLGIGGGSAADARRHAGPSGDADRWFSGHSHVGTSAIPTKKAEKGVGLLAVEGTCQ